jgi:hypothetical protein
MLSVQQSTPVHAGSALGSPQDLPRLVMPGSHHAHWRNVWGVLPGSVATATSRDLVEKRLENALVTHLEGMLEDSEELPAPTTATFAEPSTPDTEIVGQVVISIKAPRPPVMVRKMDGLLLHSPQQQWQPSPIQSRYQEGKRDCRWRRWRGAGCLYCCALPSFLRQAALQLDAEGLLCVST